MAETTHAFNGLSSRAHPPLMVSKLIRKGEERFPLHDVSKFPPNDWKSSQSLSVRSSSRLAMSFNDDENSGPGLILSSVIVVFLVIFLASSVAPMLELSQQSPMSDVSLGNAVTTVNDRSASSSTSSSSNMVSQFDRLSRTKIQEKLSNVPIFYLVNKEEGKMQELIYMSYEDATQAAASSSDTVVKATTLDQVMYPLIYQRGRVMSSMKMITPKEIQVAEEQLNSSGGTGNFQLVPSTAAKEQAKEMNVQFSDGDIPLFVADRLAFASRDGPQVPMFLDKNDCITSYQRLVGGGSSKLPETPTIRVSTLKDTLMSMEKGTKMGVSQLQFYSTETDLIKANEMIQ